MTGEGWLATVYFLRIFGLDYVCSLLTIFAFASGSRCSAVVDDVGGSCSSAFAPEVLHFWPRRGGIVGGEVLLGDTTCIFYDYIIDLIDYCF